MSKSFVISVLQKLHKYIHTIFIQSFRDLKMHTFQKNVSNGKIIVQKLKYIFLSLKLRKKVSSYEKKI